MDVIIMSYSLEALVTAIFARRMYIPRFKLPIRILIYIVLYGCAALTHSGNSMLNALVDVMVGVLVFGFVYTGDSADSLFNATILVAVNFLCELEVANIVNHFHVGFLNIVFNSNLRFLMLLARAVLFLVAMMIVYFQKKRKQTETVGTEGYLATGIVLCIMVFFAVLTNVLILIPETDKGGSLVFITLLISAIVLILTMSMFSLANKRSEELRMIQLAVQKREGDEVLLKTASEKDEKMRILIHDMKKHFQTLKLMSEYGEADRVNRYLDNLLGESDVQSVEDISNNTLLGTILYRYTLKAKENNIKMNCDIRDNCIDGIDEMTITTVLYNLLDNAMENCGGESPFISILIQKNNDSYVNITVLNRCAKAPVQNKYGDFISDKEDKSMHGLGIKSIKRTVKENGGEFSAYYSPEDNVFHAVAILYVEKKYESNNMR